MGQPEFTKRRPEVLRKPIRCVDDLLDLPEHIMRRVHRELEIEEFQEFLNARDED